jgi:hypothetical protein
MLVLLSALVFGGCGGDKGDRGLAVPNEVDTPTSAKDDAETEQQRQQQVIDEMQKKQTENFDAPKTGNPPVEKPAY